MKFETMESGTFSLSTHKLSKIYTDRENGYTFDINNYAKDGGGNNGFFSNVTESELVRIANEILRVLEIGKTIKKVDIVQKIEVDQVVGSKLELS